MTLLIFTHEGGLSLENDFEVLIAARCDKAITEYVSKLKERGENTSNTDDETLDAMNEKLCYKKGFYDAMKFMMKFYENSVNF